MCQDIDGIAGFPGSNFLDEFEALFANAPGNFDILVADLSSTASIFSV
jgi:hypothetical protein